jgi:hypothetical protein
MVSHTKTLENDLKDFIEELPDEIHKRRGRGIYKEFDGRNFINFPD